MTLVHELSTFFIFMIMAVEGYKRPVRCWKESDCNDSEFCSSRLGVCFECFPCGMFFRYPAQNNCARNRGDCGTCISGFYEVAWNMCSWDFRPAAERDSAERITLQPASTGVSTAHLTYTDIHTARSASTEKIAARSTFTEMGTARSTSTDMRTSLSTSTERTTNDRMVVSHPIYMLQVTANVEKLKESMAAGGNLHNTPDVPSSTTETVLIIGVVATSASAISIIICVLLRYRLSKTNRQIKGTSFHQEPYTSKTCATEERLDLI